MDDVAARGRRKCPAGPGGPEPVHVSEPVSVAVAAKPVVAVGVWGVGILLLVVLLEFAPKLGGALLAVIVVYLALQLPKKGV